MYVHYQHPVVSVSMSHSIIHEEKENVQAVVCGNAHERYS